MRRESDLSAALAARLAKIPSPLLKAEYFRIIDSATAEKVLADMIDKKLEEAQVVAMAIACTNYTAGLSFAKANEV